MKTSNLREIFWAGNLIFQLGWTMLGCIAIGGGFGFFLDKLFFKKIGMFFIIGLIFGVVSGFFTIYRMIMKKEFFPDDDKEK